MRQRASKARLVESALALRRLLSAPSRHKLHHLHLIEAMPTAGSVLMLDAKERPEPRTTGHASVGAAMEALRPEPVKPWPVRATRTSWWSDA